MSFMLRWKRSFSSYKHYTGDFKAYKKNYLGRMALSPWILTLLLLFLKKKKTKKTRKDFVKDRRALFKPLNVTIDCSTWPKLQILFSEITSVNV